MGIVGLVVDGAASGHISFSFNGGRWSVQGCLPTLEHGNNHELESV
jgi:hypothetical protein